MPEAHPTPKAWCPATKEQGFAGSGAPRPTCRRPIRPQRRGAPRRRNKGLRGVKHHAQLAGDPSAPRDVVPRDEGTRVRGERSTTPTWRAPTDAGPSLRRQPNLVPGVTQTPTGALSPLGPETEKSEPVARAWCRIPRRPEAPAGRHPHPAPPGRSLIQIGARPAGRSAHLRPAPRLVCNSKVGKSKNRGCPRAVPVLSAFVILICKPAAVQDSFPS